MQRSQDEVGSPAHGASKKKTTSWRSELPTAHLDSEFQFSDVCRLYSDNPRIVSADYRLSAPAHFLFLPSPDNATTVLVDVLQSVDAIASLPLWKKTLAPPPAEPAFVVRATASNGLGMFATRAIARGEPILRERPALILHDRLPVHPDQHHAFYESALAGLTPSAQTAVAALHNAHPETPEHSRLRGLVATNCLAVYFAHDPTRAFSAVCAQLCRANHACAPNAHYAPVVGTCECKLSAMRAIKEGEEITMAYVGGAAATAERRACLRERYLFECHCAACDLPEPRAEESDARRVAIGTYLDREEEEEEEEEESTARVEELIGLAEEEGMVEEAWVLAMAGMRCARKQGDQAEEGRLEVQKMNYVRMLEGNDSDELEAFARRKGLKSAEQLVILFEESAQEGLRLNYALFEKLLDATVHVNSS
ncbi:hypothetical protein C8R46DRAFT_980252 [Mycena filopes]|nr:hypothetical protein C8R46DRAFT_980252 [Mycena filopes]